METIGEIRRRVENRQGEFNLWAATLKAGNNDRSSLDYRLRDNPEVRGSICDLLDGLVEGLEKLIDTATTKSLAASPEATGTMLEPEDDTGSVFSGFSSNGSRTDSLPSIGKDDSPFSEHMFNVKTILGQLARISTVIRRSGAKYRFRRADASLQKEEFEDFRMELIIAVLMGNMADSKNTTFSSLIANITDANRLTPVQERLIQANIVRRNRINFATRSMREAGGPTAHRPKRSPSIIIKRPITAAVSTTSPSQKRVADKHAVSSQAPSIKAPSLTQTATDLGSHLEWQHVVEPKKSTPSIVTRITKTGADQDYPSCPKPIYDDFLQCSYCADLLPESYYKNTSRWKYEFTPHPLKRSESLCHHRGHVAQDILPYMCVYEACETPDQMYLTSAELLKHMLGQHGVTRWACDHCASTSEADQPFVFESQEDWVLHMKKEHHTSLPASQFPSLAKVSQRLMLDQLGCPLCGYVAKHPQSKLDDHIAKHTHAFALRCLPWGTGDNDNDNDSVDAKSAGVSNSSQDNDSENENEEPEYIDLAIKGTAERIVECLHSVSKVTFNESYLLTLIPETSYPKLSHIKDLLIKLFKSQQIPLQRRAERLSSNSRQHSSIIPLIDLIDPKRSMSARKQTRMSGRIRQYTPDSIPSFGQMEKKFEILNSHLAKVFVIFNIITSLGNSSTNSDLEHYASAVHDTEAFIEDELEGAKAILEELMDMEYGKGHTVMSNIDDLHAASIAYTRHHVARRWRMILCTVKVVVRLRLIYLESERNMYPTRGRSMNLNPNRKRTQGPYPYRFPGPERRLVERIEPFRADLWQSSRVNFQIVSKEALRRWRIILCAVRFIVFLRPDWDTDDTRGRPASYDNANKRSRALSRGKAVDYKGDDWSDDDEHIPLPFKPVLYTFDTGEAPFEDGENEQTIELGTIAIDIPTSPRPTYSRSIRRSSSVPQRYDLPFSVHRRNRSRDDVELLR